MVADFMYDEEECELFDYEEFEEMKDRLYNGN